MALGPRSEMKLTIDLYPIYYPGGRTLSLRFGGIRNIETVTKFASKMTTGSAEDTEFAWRVEGFDFDTKCPSTTDDFHLLRTLNRYNSTVGFTNNTLDVFDPFRNDFRSRYTTNFMRTAWKSTSG